MAPGKLWSLYTSAVGSKAAAWRHDVRDDRFIAFVQNCRFSMRSVRGVGCQVASLVIVF